MNYEYFKVYLHYSCSLLDLVSCPHTDSSRYDDFLTFVASSAGDEATVVEGIVVQGYAAFVGVEEAFLLEVVVMQQLAIVVAAVVVVDSVVMTVEIVAVSSSQFLDLSDLACKNSGLAAVNEIDNAGLTTCWH